MGSKYLELDAITRVRISKLVVRDVGPKGCWGWKGPSHSGGYSIYRKMIDGSHHSLLVHRLMVEERANRPVGQLENTCGARWCVNPNHWKVAELDGMSHRARRRRSRQST
jgi:hypothetical protein